MTYTLLGGLQVEQKSETKKIRIRGKGAPTFGQRVISCAVGVGWSHVFLFFLVSTFVVLAAARDVDPTTMRQDWPLAFYTAVIILPAIAVGFAVLASLRKVYLAQLSGAAVGLISGLMFAMERAMLGANPAWWEWASTPLLNAVVGFACGLRVAGKLQIEEEVEYKPIDSWDRKTKPRMLRIDLTAPERWLKVGKGIAFAIVFHLLWWGTYELLHWIRFVSETQPTGLMRQLGFSWGLVFGLVLGGILAGSRTCTGVMQGVRYSIGMTAYHLAMTKFLGGPLSLNLVVMMFGVLLVFSVSSSLFGSFAMPATRNFINSQEAGRA